MKWLKLATLLNLAIATQAQGNGSTIYIPSEDGRKKIVIPKSQQPTKILSDDELSTKIDNLINKKSSHTPTKSDGHVYAYKKGEKPLFINNVQTQKIHIAGKTIELPTSNTNASKEIAIVPAGDNFTLKIMSDEQDDAEYDSPDKRWGAYHEWEYLKIDNEFDDKAFKMARLFSNDINAVLFIAYDTKDKQYQNPDVGLRLSGQLDDGRWHDFLCMQNCLNIDFNIDGTKYPNTAMKYGGDKILLAKQPKTLLSRIKNAEIIKIRVLSVTGEPLIYVFEPEQTLDLSQLKTVK